MTCQPTHNGSVRRDVFPDDFPQALERFKEASGMTWDEIAWLLGTTTATLWRWRNAGIRPNTDYLLAIQDLADSKGLGHLLPPHKGHKGARSRSGGRRPGRIDAGASAAPDRTASGFKNTRTQVPREHDRHQDEHDGPAASRNRRGRERRDHVRPAISPMD